MTPERRQSTFFNPKLFNVRNISDPNGVLQFWTKYFEQSIAISSNFLGGAGFSMSVARRKTVLQLVSLGAAVSPPQWGPGTKPRKILAILHPE